VHALRGVDLQIDEREIHCLVGESGSGKTVAARAILGLLPPGARVEGGSIRVGDTEVLRASQEELRTMRGGRVGMVFQEPARYLNPTMRVGSQIVETLLEHRGGTRAEATERARLLLSDVGLAENDRVLHAYPHELSGGMKQRAMTAMAVCCDPDLLIADEPTTALDVTIERKILDLLCDLRRRLDLAVLFISHDLGAVYSIADRLSVVYVGKVVETGPRDSVYGSPQHPYTKLLLRSIPRISKRGERLTPIPGRVPDGEHVPEGCAFHPRCPLAIAECAAGVPELRSVAPNHFAACIRIGVELP
jgi:oligopeptide/dipeptide ABC transporter ATP-binding protein